jgi:hypothetical protein
MLASLLKYYSDGLKFTLLYIFNLSLSSDTFPKNLKDSFLVPTGKTGKRNDIGNFRGIAVQSYHLHLHQSSHRSALATVIFPQGSHLILLLFFARRYICNTLGECLPGNCLPSKCLPGKSLPGKCHPGKCLLVKCIFGEIYLRANVSPGKCLRANVIEPFFFIH